MFASFVLALREGLEAALLIGLLLGTLKKLGHTEYQRMIWFGAGLAIIASGAVGYSFNLLGTSFEGRNEEIFEGITMLLAAGLLTWVILWMRTQSRSLNERLAANVKEVVSNHNQLALFSLAFIAVIREGIELAFFLVAVSLDTDGRGVLLGASLGLAAVTVVGVLLFRSLIRLNISRFFQVTSIILVLFAAGLVAHGVHEFNEVDFIPPVIEHLWDINHIIDEKSPSGELLKALFGYNGNPSLTEVVAYILYFVILIFTGSRFLLNGNNTKKIKEEEII
jgi:high-affinity iron transporter